MRFCTGPPPPHPIPAHASPHQMHLATAFMYCQHYSYTIAPSLPLIMLMHVSRRRNVDHYVQSEGVKSGSLVHLKLERLPLYCICIIDEHFAHCCSFCPSGIINSWDLISQPCMERCDVMSGVTSEWCTRRDVPFVSTWPVKSWIFMIMHVGSMSPLCHTVGCEPRVNKCSRDAVTERMSDCSKKEKCSRPPARLKQRPSWFCARPNTS